MSADTPRPGTYYPLAWLNKLSIRAENGRSRAAPDGVVEALERRPDGALAEDAFHYLLAAERARASRAGRGLSLLLVSLDPASGQAGALSAPQTGKLFDALGLAVRETDVVGWYQEGVVAGAMLLDDEPAPAIDGHPGLVGRVAQALRQRLPLRVTTRLHVRLMRVCPKPTARDRRQRRARHAAGHDGEPTTG